MLSLLSFLLLLPLFLLIQSATIRVSDAEPPDESYWNSFDSHQFYLPPSFQSESTDKLITISSGSILGRLVNTHRNRSAYAFLGIPYAEAPEYSLRFRSPVRKTSWSPHIYDGRQVKAACGADPILTYKKDEGGQSPKIVSMSMSTHQINASRSLLHSPLTVLFLLLLCSAYCILSLQGGCSVMAVVHGGKFNFESPVVFPEEVMVDNFAASPRHVITVLIGFHLGSFGWINLSPNGEGNTTPKNLGFHDILSGLEWIQREIHHFGGEKRLVTLFGHSSGACLVDTVGRGMGGMDGNLFSSPRSSGLFSQLVIASAASLLSASEINRDVNVAASWAVAKAVGCAPSHYNYHSGSMEKQSASVESALHCLRSIPYKRIIDAQRSLYNSTEDFHGPSIDGEILPSSNWDLLPSRPLYPTLIGTVNAESRIGRYMLTPDGNGVNSTLIDEYCKHVGYGIWFARQEEVYRSCVDQYSKVVPLYYYHYTYTGSPSAFDNRWGLDAEDRPAHSEEYIYILGLHRANFSARDYEIQEIFSKVFSDFVNNGDPTPEGREWPLYEEKERNYFQIDFPCDSISAACFPGAATKFMSRANDFWIDIVDKKIAGKHTVIEKFPEGFDVFQLENLSQLLKSHYANQSTHHDKTEYAVKIGYERWTEWMEKRRAEYLIVSLTGLVILSLAVYGLYSLITQFILRRETSMHPFMGTI